MTTTLTPGDAGQVREFVAWAAAEEKPVEVVGAATKRSLGRPAQTEYVLDLSGLARIAMYEPEELVMSAAAGTRLAEIEAVLAERGQEPAFEPPDYGPLLGSPAGAATIGGVFACNLSGPRRIRAGAARDHFLGVKAVSGRGESFKSGGRVVKNVTGYDMCKLLAGSYGTLAVLTKLTFKVLPAAERTATVLLIGVDEATGVKALCEALGSPNEVSGAAYLPAPLAAGSAAEAVAAASAGVAALRVEGPAPSVAARVAALRDGVARHGEVAELDNAASATLWREVRDAQPFVARPDLLVWRLSVPPAAGPAVVAEIAREAETVAYYDWGGGLVWLGLPPRDDAGSQVVRAAVTRHGGHALLVRAGNDLRAALPVFEPQPEPLARLTARVKEAFDPRRVLNPGRMYAGL